jgi:hypothetical protein
MLRKDRTKRKALKVAEEQNSIWSFVIFRAMPLTY